MGAFGLFTNKSSDKKSDNLLPFSPSTTTSVTDQMKTNQMFSCTGFECIREAAILSTNSSSSFFKLTLYYYSELSKRFCSHINKMITTLEQFLKLEGAGHIQQEIWNKYVEDRLTYTEMKTELVKLRFLLSSIERLLNSSIESVLQTNEEAISQLVTNELNNSKTIIDECEKIISEHEIALTAQQVKVINKDKAPT